MSKNERPHALIRRFALCFIVVFLMILQNTNSFAREIQSWDYQGELFDASDENLSGTVFWTVEREEKPNDNNSYITEDGSLWVEPDIWYSIYSMNLATGKVREHELSGYLIYDDIEEKVLVAVEENETVKVYQMDKSGEYQLLLTARNVPEACTTEGGLPYTVLAYYDEYLYFYQRMDKRQSPRLIRANAEGDYYVYNSRVFECLSPTGLLVGRCLDSDPFIFNPDYIYNSFLVENPDDGSYKVLKFPDLKENQGIGQCISWIDKQTFLFCLVDHTGYYESTARLYWCDVVTGESGPYAMENGIYFTNNTAQQADYNPETHMLAHLQGINYSEDCACPTVIDLNSGESHVLREQKRTKTYTESCPSGHRIVWLK